MLLAGIIGLFVGLGLGGRYGVLVLVPAHGAGGLLVIGLWIAGVPDGRLFGSMVAASLCGNLGYLVAGLLSALGLGRGPRAQWERAGR